MKKFTERVNDPGLMDYLPYPLKKKKNDLCNTLLLTR